MYEYRWGRSILGDNMKLATLIDNNVWIQQTRELEGNTLADIVFIFSHTDAIESFFANVIYKIDGESADGVATAINRANDKTALALFVSCQLHSQNHYSFVIDES